MSFTAPLPTPVTPDAERRSDPRRQFERLTYADFGPDNGGILIDVSEGGARFQSVECVLVGESLPVKFLLPGAAAHVEATAKLIWSNDSGKGGGLQFVDLSQTAGQLIAAWVSTDRSTATPLNGASDREIARQSFNLLTGEGRHVEPAPMSDAAALEMARLLVSGRTSSALDPRPHELSCIQASGSAAETELYAPVLDRVAEEALTAPVENEASFIDPLTEPVPPVLDVASVQVQQIQEDPPIAAPASQEPETQNVIEEPSAELPGDLSETAVGTIPLDAPAVSSVVKLELRAPTSAHDSSNSAVGDLVASETAMLSADAPTRAANSSEVTGAEPEPVRDVTSEAEGALAAEATPEAVHSESEAATIFETKFTGAVEAAPEPQATVCGRVAEEPANQEAAGGAQAGEIAEAPSCVAEPVPIETPSTDQVSASTEGAAILLVPEAVQSVPLISLAPADIAKPESEALAPEIAPAAAAAFMLDETAGAEPTPTATSPSAESAASTSAVPSTHAHAPASKTSHPVRSPAHQKLRNKRTPRQSSELNLTGAAKPELLVEDDEMMPSPDWRVQALKFAVGVGVGCCLVAGTFVGLRLWGAGNIPGPGWLIPRHGQTASVEAAATAVGRPIKIEVVDLNSRRWYLSDDDSNATPFTPEIPDLEIVPNSSASVPSDTAPSVVGTLAVPNASRRAAKLQQDRRSGSNLMVLRQPRVPRRARTASDLGAPYISGVTPSMSSSSIDAEPHRPDPVASETPSRPVFPSMAPNSSAYNSANFQPAVVIEQPSSEYPPAARQQHVTGTVRVNAIIGKDGVPHTLKVISGDPRLASAALAAVAEWRYRPAQIHGEDVESEITISIEFQAH